MSAVAGDNRCIGLKEYLGPLASSRRISAGNKVGERLREQIFPLAQTSNLIDMGRKRLRRRQETIYLQSCRILTHQLRLLLISSMNLAMRSRRLMVELRHFQNFFRVWVVINLSLVCLTDLLVGEKKVVGLMWLLGPLQLLATSSRASKGALSAVLPRDCPMLHPSFPDQQHRVRTPTRVDRCRRLVLPSEATGTLSSGVGEISEETDVFCTQHHCFIDHRSWPAAPWDTILLLGF